MLSDLEPDVQILDLAQRLEATRSLLATQDAYYRGIIPFPLTERRYAEVYRSLTRQARPKWGKLIITAAAQRLGVEGFLASGATEPSPEMWHSFVDAGLDLAQNEVHVEACKHGRAYVSVWPHPDGVHAVPESPWETIHWRSPDRTQNLAAKVWPEGDVWRARLYTPDAVYAWVARRTDAGDSNSVPTPEEEERGEGRWSRMGALPLEVNAWEPDGDPLPNPFAPNLPIVPFVAGAHMSDVLGRSDLQSALDIIDRIMSMQVDLLLVSKVMGFPVRWATGIEAPVDSDGNPMQTFTTQIERFLTTDSPEARFGQLPAADLRQIAQTIQDIVVELAAVTETPSSVLQSSNLANPASAEALRAQEIPLVHRVKRHQREFSVPWIQVVRLLTGNTDPMEVAWAEAEVQSEAALTDSLVKQVAGLGVPREAAWEQLPDVTPTTVARWRMMAAGQAIEDRVAAALDAAASGETPTERSNGDILSPENLANPSNPAVTVEIPGD